MTTRSAVAAVSSRDSCGAAVRAPRAPPAAAASTAAAPSRRASEKSGDSTSAGPSAACDASRAISACSSPTMRRSSSRSIWRSGHGMCWRCGRVWEGVGGRPKMCSTPGALSCPCKLCLCMNLRGQMGTCSGKARCLIPSVLLHSTQAYPAWVRPCNSDFDSVARREMERMERG
eukprot:51701-Chlamydomonas_euryale.AAC.3